MNGISVNMVQPNLPLRKPSSSPMTPPPRQTIMPGATPVRPSSGAFGDAPVCLPGSRETSGQLLGSPLQTVCLCNFCGKKGTLRCKRCKKMLYCSVACQTEDWKAHRHVCKLFYPEDKAKESPPASPVAGDRAIVLEVDDHSSTNQRVFLKDLRSPKVIHGSDIQASVVEFYSPARFYVIAQSPELLEALQSITTELQKTYSRPSVTTYVPCVGEVCMVQFSCDLKWYRGLVQTLSADQKTAHILYIDFGNEENVPVERIKPLSADIQPFSPCAMECRIAGVVPVVDSWSGECCIALRQLLAGKIVTVKLLETVEDGRVHLVDILLSMGKHLSTFLIEQHYAMKETVNLIPTRQDIKALVSASLENFRSLSDGKDKNIWAQPPEPMTQAVGDRVLVVVTHLQSPDELVVQKVKNAGVIQDLQLKLREHCAQVEAPQNFRPAPGTVCCAQFSEDRQWYRAKILAYSSGERVCVGYLDFGNSEEVDLGHLRPISASLLALPMQAMPCVLAGVQPVGESWSKDCLLALQRRVSNRILQIEIQGAHGGKASVAMIDEASDPQANIAELLISAGYAAPAPVTCGDHQGDETPATSESQVSLQSRQPLVWSSVELPLGNQTVALLASVVENPGEFYCCTNNPGDEQRLTDLGAQLKEHCQADASAFVPKVGEPCCAMFPGDGTWYRAVVKGVHEDGVAVNFVDYGYNVKVQQSQLRSITPRLLALPFQAIRCWLKGVEPAGSEWSSEALLWFQTLVAGETLYARVFSVTERGYGVELESRGQNVAAALISEHLAKVPGEFAKEAHAKTSGAKQQEAAKENRHSQLNVGASDYTEAGSKEMPVDGQTVVPAEALCFPVDWTTGELPLNEVFQPYVAAVISPSLFYLLDPTRVDQKRLQEVKTELASYCTNNQATLSSAGGSRPAPGAACCAQFYDDDWYRAVVLGVDENEVSVIYADYGNREKVPFSRVLPIPAHLLQVPLQITRCALIGREHFPAEWPAEVQELFQTLMSSGVLATVHSFDGSYNVLSVSLPIESGGGHLTSMILDALQAESNPPPPPTTTTTPQKTDTTGSSTSIGTTPAPENKTGPLVTAGSIRASEKITCQSSATENPVKRIVEEMEPRCHNTSDAAAPQGSGRCCCLSEMKTKIDHLEQLMQLQLSVIKQLVGQTE
ncbi:tudor domain-containing protein 1 isoform X2 [Mugil cephalus]|uniref:tudor domain-containing protein 1 isoform X2 n=1 Tax=Mugil cephalus TaxID=48193 RepID=UPI001FB5F86B|nr:tudor domain-containing protein 1 isoform X2 [Mugil cephalus]